MTLVMELGRYDLFTVNIIYQCPDCDMEREDTDFVAIENCKGCDTDCSYCNGRGFALVQKYEPCPKCFAVLHQERWNVEFGDSLVVYSASLAARLTVEETEFYTGVCPSVDIRNTKRIWYIGAAPHDAWLEDVEAAKMLLEDIRENEGG